MVRLAPCNAGGRGPFGTGSLGDLQAEVYGYRPFAVVTIDGRSFRVAKDAGEPVSERPARDDRQAQLLAAITGLEEGNPDHWTKSGKPEVRTLETATGLKDLTATERDTVWAAYQEQQANG